MVRSSNFGTRAFHIESLEARTLLSAAPSSYTLLKNISIGSQSSLPEQFQTVNGKVLFLAYDPTHGQMLWSTDGTPGGTSMVADLNPNPQNGEFQGYGQTSIVIGNEMYFAGTDYAHGTELWKTDGTTAGTQLVGDLNPGLDSSDFSGFTNFNGKLAFQSLGQLWISDGTPGGTISLGALNPTGVGGTTDRMAVLGNKLYFSRYAGANPTGHDTGELWSTDGTVAGTQMVVDLSPGSDGRDNINATPSDLITVGNTLYFAGDDGTHGWELYRSDGTASGTAMVADLAPPPTTGSTGTVSPLDGSYPTNLTDVNGTLFFTASADYGTPQLYRLDGNGQPREISDDAESPQSLTAVGDTLYFTAIDLVHGRELWKSDGTAAGTQLVADIDPGASDSGISGITAVGENIFFTANDGTDGPELWSTDGTSANTFMLASSDQGTSGSSPGDFTALNGKLIFEANVFGDGEEPFAVTIPPASVVSPTPVTTSPVTVVPVTVVDGPTVTLLSTSKSEIDLKFSADVSASFGRGSFSLSNIDTGLRLDPATIRVTYNRKTNVARITFRNKIGNVMPTGHYRLRIASGKVKDSAGNAMLQNASFPIAIQSRKKS